MSLKAAAKETKTLLAQQQNLLVLDYRAGTFSNPAHVWVAPRISEWWVASALSAAPHWKRKLSSTRFLCITLIITFPYPPPILDETLTRPTITATLQPNNVPYPRIYTLEDHWQNKWGRGGGGLTPSYFETKPRPAEPRNNALRLS